VRAQPSTIDLDPTGIEVYGTGWDGHGCVPMRAISTAS
jgi:hypothetical protein